MEITGNLNIKQLLLYGIKWFIIQADILYHKLSFVLSLKKGVIPTPRGARNVRWLVIFPREEHSKKPVKVIEGISKMFPFQEKFILFARENYNG